MGVGGFGSSASPHLYLLPCVCSWRRTLAVSSGMVQACGQAAGRGVSAQLYYGWVSTFFSTNEHAPQPRKPRWRWPQTFYATAARGRWKEATWCRCAVLPQRKLAIPMLRRVQADSDNKLDI